VEWREYLEETDNTICGSHPIGVLLEAIRQSKGKFEVELVDYGNSGIIKDPKHDSQVSYASIVIKRID